MKFIIVIAIVLVVLVVAVVVLYNSLVALKNKVEEGWAQIDVQLKRRTDLIPNLVETVKGYATHEKSVFENVTRARATLQQAETPKEASKADGELTEALGRLFAVGENYPDLKANQNFLSLQEEISTTENRVSFARQYYNDAVNQFNTKIGSFPWNLLASRMQYSKQEYFEVENEADKQVPQVKF